MKRLTIVAAFVLLIVNLGATAYLVFRLLPEKVSSTSSYLTNDQVAQIDRLFKLILEFRTELENVAGRATFPNEKEKTAAKDYLRDHKMALEVIRLTYLSAREYRTRAAAFEFLRDSYGVGQWSYGSGAVMFVPSGLFGTWSLAKDRLESFPNANISRLESIAEEFKVLAISLAKDLK